MTDIITTADKLACAKRELAKRKYLYPRFIEENKLGAGKAAAKEADMSSESACAMRMALYYGSKTSRMTRRERIMLLEQRTAVLLQDDEDEQRAHRSDCEACQKGTFCFDALCYTPAQRERADELSRIRNYLHLEHSDEAYAQTARIHSVRYEHHIDGFCAYWQNLRHRLFVVAAHRCQRCGAHGPLEAHHLHYDTLGFEELDDLQALCRKCHQIADGQRTYTTALETYASKKYGEYWKEDRDIECLLDEFDNWLEERGG